MKVDFFYVLNASLNIVKFIKKAFKNQSGKIISVGPFTPRNE